jgi:hypothetical protein
MSEKTQVPVCNRELKIWYAIDGKSADEIAEIISEKHGVACTGDDVVALLKERKVQTRAIRRSEKSFVFVNTDAHVSEENSTQEVDSSNNLQDEGLSSTPEPFSESSMTSI